MARKKNKKPVQVASLFKGLLPEGYLQKNAQIQQYQYFFESQESDAVFQMVKVTNVTDQYLNVTLPNATLSSYLRLHGEQIRQLVMENFGVDLILKISTRPEISNQLEDREIQDWLPDISRSSCDQITNAADYVEDDDLKNALKSLSKTLSKNSK